MPQPVADPWLDRFATIVFFASALTWLYLAAKWQRDGRLLAYEPRRPVPWGAWATLLAVALALLTVLSGTTMERGASRDAGPNADETAAHLIDSLLPIITLSSGFTIAVAVYSRATIRDLGFPANGREFARDVCLGAVVCLAATIPVFTVLMLLQKLLGVDELSHHPFVQIVRSSGNLEVLMLTTVATVLVAPVFEEINFRLLLQGWLERREQQMRGKEDGSFRPRWMPILISSLLFAAAHYGYGPEPVPIFVLALFLGYTYQRTHRIVPCMVAHGLFNSLSMIELWRMSLSGR